LRQLPHAQLLTSNNSKSSIEELLGQDHNSPNHVLKVSEDDVEQCYCFAERVGNKWAEVLQRQGYCEFAEIAFDIVKQGHFLEPSVKSSPTDDNANDESNSNKYVSPYTALHALRRYPPDCDGSGLPSKYLPALDDSNGENNSNIITTASCDATLPIIYPLHVK